MGAPPLKIRVSVQPQHCLQMRIGRFASGLRQETCRLFNLNLRAQAFEEAIMDVCKLAAIWHSTLQTYRAGGRGRGGGRGGRRGLLNQLGRA